VAAQRPVANPASTHYLASSQAIPLGKRGFGKYRVKLDGA
jgi:hypothetical protein